jgi:acyl-CoA oxidase
MLYVAWADGSLTADQVREIHHVLGSLEGFDEASREVVRQWLDPKRPPSAHELDLLLSVVRRQAADLPEDERYSLAELGIALLREPSEDEHARQQTLTALRSIEQALGIAGHEASRELRAPRERRRSTAAPIPPDPFDVAALAKRLSAPYHAIRRSVFDIMSDPTFQIDEALADDAYREAVLERCQRLADEGIGALAFPREHGGTGDFGQFIAAFETLGHGDLSVLVKFGVQFGLFGGSVLLLGTERHHKLHQGQIGRLELPGCFAMTELGHGSNVWDIETVASYDRAAAEFVISTPVETARKEWIGNAAKHGRMATVFAQLEIDGEGHGVHAFLVPIRNRRGKPLPGVRIEDCGHKQGLNGVDNGRLWFDGVRIPRENLLNRYADVTADGQYTSHIESPYRRFFTMLGTLVGGRVSIGGGAISAAKTALTVAVRYACRRRQFGPAGEREVPILDYQSIQHRVFPLLATTYALTFAQQYLVRRFLERTEDDQREIEALAAGLKAYATWHAIDTLQQCREACGGQGYLAINRIPDLKADADIFATFEGDNTVLMQLVAKALLTDYRDQFGEMRLWGIVRLVADRTATRVAKLNPITVRLTDQSHLQDPDFQLGVFRYREQRLLATAARRLKARLDDGADSFAAFNECQNHLVSLGRAHVERWILEQVIAESKSAADADPLVLMRHLYALGRIEADRGWFLENNVIEGNKSKAIRALVTQLCLQVRPLAVGLVDAFGIPEAVLRAPIASSIDPRPSQG